MEMKCIEIRDVATCIPALAILMESNDSVDRAFLGRSGYAKGTNLIMLFNMNGGRATYDPYSHDSLTMRDAHLLIQTFWEHLENGDIIDVEYFRQQTNTPKDPEIVKRRDHETRFGLTVSNIIDKQGSIFRFLCRGFATRGKIDDMH